MVDVKSKKCVEEGCNKQPAFNFLGEYRPKFCTNHKKTNMVDVKNKRCVEEGCNKIPVFNFQGE